MNLNKNYFPKHNISGFTLLEMAVVLAVIALLLGGLLPTISSQIEQAQRKETRNALAEIKQALLGYAIIYGELPCPTIIADPADPNYGIAAATCNATTAEGYLPWRTLGVSEIDAWGLKRSATGDAWVGYWRYRLDDNFDVPFTLTTDPVDALTIENNVGDTITAPLTDSPIAIVFSTGPDITPNGKNGGAFDVTYQSDIPRTTFDDMLVLISRPQLFNRMVSAGRLP